VLQSGYVGGERAGCGVNNIASVPNEDISPTGTMQHPAFSLAIVRARGLAPRDRQAELYIRNLLRSHRGQTGDVEDVRVIIRAVNQVDLAFIRRQRIAMIRSRA